MPPQDTETARWFASEVQPFEPELRRYLHAFVGGSDVDDLVQETYARLIRARNGTKITSPRGLLFITARNAARDILRRSAVAKTIAVADLDELNVLDNSPVPSEALSVKQEIEMLNAAINALPDRCRSVFVLRRIHGLPHREIANQLGISVHTVQAHLTNGIGLCERYFEKHGILPKI